MTRSRLVVVVSFSVVAVGVLGALGALLLGPGRTAIGPLPAEGLILPADARLVMGVDVRRVVASAAYQKLKARWPGGRLGLLQELEDKTGLDPERDLERLLIAERRSGEAGPAPQLDALILALGQLDRDRLRAIEAGNQTVRRKDVKGTSVYLFEESKRGPMAVAMLDGQAVLLGSRRTVEEAVASHVEGARPLESNAELVRLLDRVEPGSAFWMLADRSLLSQLPQTLPALGGLAGAGISLPAIHSLVVSGNVEPVLSLRLTAEAADAAEANSLADVVRALSALITLQASQKPELKELASAISVTTEASQVHVNARLSDELIEALMARARAWSQNAPEP